MFYQKCSEAGVNLIRTSRIFGGVVYGGDLASRSPEEEFAMVQYGGDEFGNFVMNESHDWLFEQIEKMDYSTIAKEEW